MYGGGLMLSSTLEYFGFLNLWVPPPDTDELAEQAIDVWKRIHPDITMTMLSQHRFTEVAAKLGVDPVGQRGASMRRLERVSAQRGLAEPYPT